MKVLIRFRFQLKEGELTSPVTVNEINFCGDVVNSHFVKAEVPIFLIAIRHADVMPTVCISSSVAQPNVIAAVGEKKCERLIRSAQNPIGRACENSVLEKHWLLHSVSTTASSARYSVQVQHVTIFSDNRVTFS